MKQIRLLSALVLIISISSCKKESSLEVISAVYSVSYKVNHDGRYFIEIPKVYEFANTILAIKDMDNPTLFTQRETAYYQEFYNHYYAYRYNDLLSQYNFHYADIEGYLGVSMNGFKYEYYHGQLESKNIYNEIAIPDLFSSQLELVNKLYIQSDFETFYTDNEYFYQNQIRLYDSVVPVNNMWSWLEKEFSTKVNSYTVLLSPLSKNRDVAHHFQTPDFNETLLFLCGMPEELPFSDSVSLVKLGQSTFINMTVDYIEPASIVHATTIETSMSRRVIWKQNLEANQAFDTPFKIFNEYLKWTTYCIYAKEHFSSDIFNTINTNIETYMVDEMGFIRFRDFNEKCMALHTESSIEDLYPQLLEWADAINDN